MLIWLLFGILQNTFETAELSSHLMRTTLTPPPAAAAGSPSSSAPAVSCHQKNGGLSIMGKHPAVSSTAGFCRKGGDGKLHVSLSRDTRSPRFWQLIREREKRERESCPSQGERCCCTHLQRCACRVPADPLSPHVRADCVLRVSLLRHHVGRVCVRNQRQPLPVGFELFRVW